MFGAARKLAAAGVLGLNKRNSELIMRFNPRRFYPTVDNKELTKRLAMEAGMAVPDLYGVVHNQGEVRNLAQIVAHHDSFVIKPAHGSGGDGIVVVAARSKRKRDSFRLASGLLVSYDDLKHHTSNVVGGQYSLSGNPDVAMIEYCVQFDPLFNDVSFQGVPDIRVIVYRGYPIMAMVRLPTRSSDGKANLHQGAVGAGIDMQTGRTLAGVLKNGVVDEHPDTGALIGGLQISDWDFILQSSARALEVTGLGYVGVDIVIDRQLGPLILEMNARPGLNIQIANRAGIWHRIETIDRLFNSDDDAERRAAIAREQFPGQRPTTLPPADRAPAVQAEG
ncbi:MAG: alpha-L-glutamate ligase-like protein [Woeseiaceae bacterium]|nr:alpha-L-glutamate ligase-like protein [Woeseiaceae bacterium]